MTKEEGNIHLEAGNRSALKHLRQVNPLVAGIEDEGRIIWWSGFIVATIGAACASIGPEAAKAVLLSVGPMIDEAAKNIGH